MQSQLWHFLDEFSLASGSCLCAVLALKQEMRPLHTGAQLLCTMLEIEKLWG